jgi:hypothetical protein
MNQGNQNTPIGKEDLDGSAIASPALRAPDMIPGPLNPLPGPIDFSKPVQTKNSKTPVRIIAIDYSLSRPVIGVIQAEYFDKEVSCWSISGIYSSNGSRCGLDLENVPEAVNPSPSPMGEK